jgi:tripartite-type tricarboxylate transporter receptor subunit TctC
MTTCSMTTCSARKNRSRRGFLHLVRLVARPSLLFGVLFPVLPRPASAQAYPVRPVRLLVGFPAGGPNDTLARLMGQWLPERLGQPFLVENLPGSSGNIATEAVVRAPPDGYTLLLVGPANAISASVSSNLNFSFLRDIAPIAGITREPLVMVVHPSVPTRTVAQFMAYAKADPAAVKMAATGEGSSPHVSGELFKMMAGIDLSIAQYAGGGPALRALTGGEAQVMFEPISAAIEAIRSGQLRALAVTTAMRCEALPDVPTMAESLPGYEASAVTGIGAPRDIPVETVDILNQAINAAFADPQMKQRLADTGGMPLPGSPAQFARTMAEETEKWAKVIKSSRAKPN